MLASPASQITSTISEYRIMHLANGGQRPDYGWTQAIMMSVTFSLLIIWTACGPERRGSHFELAKAAGDTNELTGKKDWPSEEGAVAGAPEARGGTEGGGHAEATKGLRRQS